MLIIPRLCVCLLHSVTENNNNKECPEQPGSLGLLIRKKKKKKKRKSCCDKLRRWLNTAIRQHTVCLTKCFLSNTLELSWPLAAWFQVFIWALLWGSVSISDGFRFSSPLRPRRRGHMVRRRWRGCCSWITHSPWWSHVGSQWWSTASPPSIRQRPFCVTLWHICWHVSFGNRC